MQHSRRKWTMGVLGGLLMGGLAYGLLRPEGAPQRKQLADLLRSLDAPEDWIFALDPVSEPVVLKAPVDPDPPVLVKVPAYRSQETADQPLKAVAYQYDSRVYKEPATKPVPVGYVRRGITLRVDGEVPGPGCAQGAWYQVSGGVVCSRDGFAITERDVESRRQPPPKVSRGLPYRYGRVTSRKALRYYRIPTPAEEAAIEQALANGEPLPDLVMDKLDGDYFVAMDRVERDGDREFLRTIPGYFVKQDLVDPRPEPTMRGELLDEELKLPVAFVFGSEQVELYAPGDGQAPQIGIAEKHARFALAEVREVADKRLALNAKGQGVALEHVRIARPLARPDDIPAGVKWLHVDLTEQTLVAYEGDVPVFVTLVSTGREGYDTPTGLFRVHEKHTSTTMRGDDPKDGHFEVSEVPWTMFYDGNYALHGAYWHNDFGRVRSHGCTNLSPVDARFLFHFIEDPLPQGWHTRRDLEGTWVYLTRAQETARAGGASAPSGS